MDQVIIIIMLVTRLLAGYHSEDILYMAKAVEAEAGICSYEEKLNVASCIWNRVESDDFPDTIKDVIQQPGQFAVYANQRINTVEVTIDSLNAVKAVISREYNSEILYFANYEICSSEYQAWFDTLQEIERREYMRYYR